MFDIREVWKCEPLKDGISSILHKFLKDRIFVLGGSKKLLPDYSFGSGFQEIVLASLQLFSCAFYYVGLGNI